MTTMSEMGHEQVVFCNDTESGLKAIIAVHNTVLGPSLGGTRFWNYTNETDAIVDVLRLSRGMTYKSSLCGNNLGGGKAVIIGDATKIKSREALFRSYGKFVNSLNGKYITAEDVGTSTGDMVFISQETKAVAGLPESMGGGGDPSPVTAYGVYLGIKASAKYVYGNDSLTGKKILVQGVGHVGQYLIDHLIKENAVVMISDINEERIKTVTAKHKVEVIEKEKVYDSIMDIYAPCALGATLNDDTIPKLTCAIVAGAANNQLKDETKHGRDLIDRNIVYAPDYLINAGGVINCYVELEGYNKERAFSRTDIIYNRTLEVFDIAKKEKITTQEAANSLAKSRITAIAKINARM
ncbi:MAG: Glu/Leu/Phe/Val dehydrogenase [Fimbriimonadaceae bacterium]|nr:Glu/Leu/Phe/Val dehydrogenase [Chitinophagales bacterium]